MSIGRSERLREIDQTAQWDVLVVGGGASGLGTAVEAASRGYRTLLLERDDFAKGTSSRSTKLVHGGVRYLEQMNFTLVLDALRERGYMLRNAPHLVHKLGFIVPLYSYFGVPYYGFGLKMYEWLSGKLSFGPSQVLSRGETLERLPTVTSAELKGGILYQDGQFDDARYAITLMRTLEDLGGVALNYAQVIGLLKSGEKITGVRVRDCESSQEFDVQAKVVVNATGAFTEQMLRMDAPTGRHMLSISQGTHFVLPRKFLPSGNAMMVPKTADGRVLFAIPWHEHLVVGTTDVAVPASSSEPRATEGETTFLSEHIHRYLGQTVQPSDVLSMWSGLRPLVRNGNESTSKLSRDHRVIVSESGLVTVTGGKWTTYRRMGEDTVNHAAQVAGLAAAPSTTSTLRLHGWAEPDAAVEESERVYGADLPAVRALGDSEAELNELLHPKLPYRKFEVIWAARQEQARTVEDVLARRTRALFLNASAAIEAAPEVARLLARELGRDDESRERDLARFRETAEGYIYRG
ncbi:glycerol-3-phosphate dehydrogenase [Edaphobacter acidisoli]|uniref:Glycerol-3-phosphate dehydrogenase n=1 Tax=Edaphobacter acidisoli TaxID=2040573 RepID=A0A916W169_9BACT|nr:glycerol-3-phosphate dehydrogenase/oxidase [Edaphobacter acidisoli]GGA59344.1 glycerol-3-phosphate dehydrogenase [Edaphobacter acidisoli]